MRILGPATTLGHHERLALDSALADAFAPLRARSANISAARVRAAVRWSAPEPRPLRGIALLTRVSELSVAAAISAFLFAGTVASLEATPPMPDTSRDAVASDEWVLNGRNALQRPIDSRATDYRTTAGDLAANAATARHPASIGVVPTVRDSEPFAARP
ncbi:MAG TPA: hypothetical protein VKR80_05070 [Candidatus Limnocylindria bacterium]|nr:hypothetical protein [Candidatus Limnocylindria bacterium]